MELGVGFWLNMLLAAVASALYMGFATEERARASARSMRERYFQVRVGFIVVGLGVGLQALGHALTLWGHLAFGLLLHGASYAFMIVGLLVVAATTWGDASAEADGDASPEEVAG